MRVLLILSVLASASFVSISEAQSPMPVVVPAMTPATTAKGPASPDNVGSTQTTLKTLQAIKAANEEILKQQAATLLKLDEIEKTATEIRIYTKRS